MARTRKKSAANIIGKCANIAAKVLHYPTTLMQYDYDEAADLVYVYIRRPKKTPKTVVFTDNISLLKEGSQIIGLIIHRAGKQ